MRPVLVAAARPNFPKVAPLHRALLAAGADPVLVHTGQHYDREMSASLFDDLGLPCPDVNLGAGPGSHGAQTARVMTSFEAWLEDQHVDQVVTVGDVNSTLACALVAVKRGIPVAHVEAGLRSFDRRMPEEVNRLAVDAVATWLFTPSADAEENLLAEGAHPSRIHPVGNVMVDSLLASLPRALAAPPPAGLEDLGDRYGLVTLHRPALVDDPGQLGVVLAVLAELAEEIELVFPVHPRTAARIADSGLTAVAGRIRFVGPQSYLGFLRLEAGASVVLTDSGGVQEETTVLGVPCLTLRENTERPVTITHGTNTLVGFDPHRIRAAAAGALASVRQPCRPPLWDGLTSTRVAAILLAGTPEVEWMPPAVADRRGGDAALIGAA